MNWAELSPGTELAIEKISPEDTLAASYPGTVVNAGAESPWIASRAIWPNKEIEQAGLRFVPDDLLNEFFSPTHNYNVFSIWTPEGALRGWYANVTHPATIDFSVQPPLLRWYDLYVDLIAFPDGRYVILDEDELEESGLAASNPSLHRMILEMRDELVRLFENRAFPFHEVSIER
jgi:protein associated with RNAse G/E